MKPDKRIVFNVFSVLLVSLSLLFICFNIIKYKMFLLSFDWNVKTIAVVLTGACGYLLCCVFLSLAWRRLLEIFGRIELAARLCHYIYATTQIGKYIPGNVFQIVGRHTLGNKLGLKHDTLTYAAFFELAGVASVAGVISLVAILVAGSEAFDLSIFKILIVVGVAAFSGLAFLKVLPLAANRMGLDVRLFSLKNTVPKLLPAFALYLYFFSCCGLILFALISFISGHSDWGLAPLSVAAFSASYLSGLITPGSPSGLGVREAVLILILGRIIGEGEAVVVAFSLRGVTVLGDILFFALANLFLAPSPNTLGGTR